MTSAVIRPEIETFLVDLYNAVCDRSQEDIRRLYDQDFLNIGSPHPTPEEVESFYSHKRINTGVVLSLYQELYFRHNPPRTFNDFLSAYCNYRRLLEYFREVECDRSNASPIPLPPGWIWDIVHEVSIQYLTCQELKATNAPEFSGWEAIMDSLLKTRFAWTFVEIEGWLTNIVAESRILEATSLASRAEPCPTPPLYMGYFSMIALCKLYVSTGDFLKALDSVSSIDLLSKSGWFLKMLSCHTVLFYCVSFSLLMTRHYVKAQELLIHFFSSITFKDKRLQQQPATSTASNMNLLNSHFNAESMADIQESMLGILLLTSELSNVPLTDDIVRIIQERWKRSHLKITNLVSSYTDVFYSVCPDFIDPLMWSFEDSSALLLVDVAEPRERQGAIFISRVKKHLQMKSALAITKCYNSVTLDKITSFLNLEDNDDARALLCSLSPSNMRVVLEKVQIQISANTVNYISDFLATLSRIQDLINQII